MKVSALMTGFRSWSMLEKTGILILAAMLAGLAGRIFSYPLNRDENLFIAVSSQLGHGDLYRDFGYNHLPNMPFLLGGLYFITDTGHYLLVGRLMILAFWLLAILTLWLIARQVKADRLTFLVTCLMLLGSTLMLGPPGILVTNNFIPIPLAFLGIYYLLRAIDHAPHPSVSDAFRAGFFASLAIGFKSNYIFLAPFFAGAILLAKMQRPLRTRLVYGLLPLAFGGVVGALPGLIHFAADPQGFLAHTLRYFTELQPAFWAHSDDPAVTGIKDKALLAESIWFSGTSLLTLAGIGISGLLIVLAKKPARIRQMPDIWPIIMTLGLIACGILVSFAPSPSFPQYFVPPLPFLVLLFLLIVTRSMSEDSTLIRPVLLTLGALALLGSVTRILPGIGSLLLPWDWEGISLHREMQQAAGRAQPTRNAYAATLTPVLALEAGYRIYPEFVAGQFVYRVAPYISPEDQPYYRTTSPEDLDSFLAQKDPQAIIVNMSEPMEQPFADYAINSGYRDVMPSGESGKVRLFVQEQ
ncbi:MAG: glycosyltransferase family 39 protein [Sphingomonadaceae bacterium]